LPIDLDAPARILAHLPRNAARWLQRAYQGVANDSRNEFALLPLGRSAYRSGDEDDVDPNDFWEQESIALRGEPENTRWTWRSYRLAISGDKMKFG
jgi:hypothetical protein